MVDVRLNEVLRTPLSLESLRRVSGLEKMELLRRALVSRFNRSANANGRLFCSCRRQQKVVILSNAPVLSLSKERIS